MTAVKSFFRSSIPLFTNQWPKVNQKNQTRVRFRVRLSVNGGMGGCDWNSEKKKQRLGEGMEKEGILSTQ